MTPTPIRHGGASTAPSLTECRSVLAETQEADMTDISKEAVERLAGTMEQAAQGVRAVNWCNDAAETLRALSARLAEVEAGNRGLVRLNEATQARAEAAEARLAVAREAIRWALGENGDFSARGDGEGAYWWRRELRRMALPILDAGTTKQEWCCGGCGETDPKKRCFGCLHESPPPMPHPDDLAVDLFAVQMKSKLAKKRADGRGGWDDPAQCSPEFLRNLLWGHMHKGDPVDVANFCMMLAHHGEKTTPTPEVSVGEAARVLLADDDAMVYLAVRTMRNNKPKDGKRVGYLPALTAALRALSGDTDHD